MWDGGQSEVGLAATRLMAGCSGLPPSGLPAISPTRGGERMEQCFRLN
jgi:hypothetical protein